MTCNCLNTNCAPCTDCTQEPVEPCKCRCGDIALPDGRYEHATIVVENGCITVVEAGEIPLYTPNVCCAGTGSGSGGGGVEGPEGPKGDPGENATISIGTVSTLAPGSQATVVNTGTTTNAVLDFGIPAGAQGASGANPNGITSDKGGIQIDTGAIVGLPASWPPVLYILADSKTTGFTLSASAPDQSTGMVTLDIDASKYDEAIRNYINTELTNKAAELQSQISALNTALAALQSSVDYIQKHCCGTV